MERVKLTWFGIKLTHKQATNIFILSMVGTFFLSLILVPYIFMFISMYINSISWGEVEYFFSTLTYILPYFIVLFCFLICCIYSLLRSRKIAKYYPDTELTKNTGSRSAFFCPNCGNKRIGEEAFCKICGEAFT